MARQFPISALKVLLFLMLFQSQAMAQGECKKDLLLIVDTSFSIKETNFNKQIKPFLNQLINEKVLNVGEEGTHIALMLFSQEEKTETVLPFDKVYSKDALSSFITALDWDKVKGDHTRTDIALKMANETFSSKSPANHRKTVQDVIVIITDGKPQGVSSATEDAKRYAQDLKNKEVVIIGVGVGDITTKPDDMRTLQDISSPGQTIEAEFGGIEDILETLVTKSCQSYSGLYCTCPFVQYGTIYLKPGEPKILISWEEPIPSCREQEMSLDTTKTIVNPLLRSPHAFEAGNHSISYTYFLTNGRDNITCSVNLEIKGITALCRGKPFSQSNQECCCGVIHEKQTGFRCCGIDYYQTSRAKCCPGANVRNKEKSCFEPACKCPSMPLIIKYKKPGETNAVVSWELPKPKCENRLVSVIPSVSPGGTFPIGLHNIKYLYKIFNRYDVICQVDFEVKECKCPPLYLTAISVKPGALTVKVQWREPRPDCPEVAIKISEPQHKPGDAFTIGKHKIRYVYNIDNKFDLVCLVTFQVKGAICRDKGYNIATEECCCGTIYTKVPGFRCCEQDYYEIATQKCCPNSVVRSKDVSCPTQ